MLKVQQGVIDGGVVHGVGDQLCVEFKQVEIGFQKHLAFAGIVQVEDADNLFLDGDRYAHDRPQMEFHDRFLLCETLIGKSIRSIHGLTGSDDLVSDRVGDTRVFLAHGLFAGVVDCTDSEFSVFIQQHDQAAFSLHQLNRLVHDDLQHVVEHQRRIDCQ